MKTIVKFFVLAGCVVIVGCTKQKSAEELLKDNKMRSDIMTAICNDSSMSEEMYDRMTTTGVSQKMFPLTCEMLNKIMASEAMKHDTTMQNIMITNMLQLMSKDTVLCDKTCTKVNNVRQANRLRKK